MSFSPVPSSKSTTWHETWLMTSGVGETFGYKWKVTAATSNSDGAIGTIRGTQISYSEANAKHPEDVGFLMEGRIFANNSNSDNNSTKLFKIRWQCFITDADVDESRREGVVCEGFIDCASEGKERTIVDGQYWVLGTGKKLGTFTGKLLNFEEL